jgi:hypothetical protein
MKKINTVIVLIFGFICSHAVLFGQGEIDEQNRILFRDEQTFAGFLNSNGLGINYRYGKRINAFNKTIYDVDLAHIKHSKEEKSPSPLYPNGRSFVYGKLNNFYNLRAGMGIQREMFRKFDKGGISIRFSYMGGLSVGVLKPIYYEFISNTADPERIVDKFPENDHPTIIGRASYFKGFDELEFVPGGYGKLAVTFEFSKMDEIIQAIETGVTLDLFYKKIPIMATSNNNFIFLSLSLGYRFGKVIDKGLGPKEDNNQSIDDFLLEF